MIFERDMRRIAFLEKKVMELRGPEFMCVMAGWWKWKRAGYEDQRTKRERKALRPQC